MKQGNGTEILGVGDPRSTTIGIIYVSSVDDRKSVLTAILAQEELGRKQIAVVLPAQNKAFQRAQDFDILKHLPRKLRARLIIIAPAGSSPAELARRQRFTVYSTLENYANALRAEAEGTGQAGQDEPPKKFGWLFGSARFKTPASPAQEQQHGSSEPARAGNQANIAQPPPPGASLPPLPPAPASANHQAAQADQTDLDANASPGQRNGHSERSGRNLAIIAGAGAAGAGAGLLAADMMRDTQGFGQSPSSLAAENQAGTLNEQPPVNAATSTDAAQSVQPVQPVQPGADGAAASFYATQQMDDALPPVQPGDDETEQDDQVQQNDPAQRSGSASAIIASGTAGAAGAAAFSAGRGSENAAQPPQTAQAPGEQGPLPLELPARRNTPIKLPPPPAAPGPGQQATSARTASPARRNSGKIAAGAAGAAAGAALARTGGSGNVPPQGAAGGGGGGGGGPSGGGGHRPWWIAAALIFFTVLVIAAILVSLAYAYPGTFGPLGNFLPKGAPPATVTITPSYKDISNNYIIQAVPGQANPDQLQVTARQLSAKQSQQRTIKATGHNQQPAKAATGRLTFYNGSLRSFTVAAGTELRASNGARFVTDTPAPIPAGNPPTYGIVTVPAHAVTGGTNGNIGPGAINGTCCTEGNFILVKNLNAFTGGQDAKDYNFVKQGDYDSAVNTVRQQLTQQVNADLAKQLKSGEQLAGASQCPADITKDKAVGDQGVNVDAVNVTITVNCTAVAYDQNGMQSIVLKRLQDKAAQEAGAGYALKGKIILHSRVQQINQDNSVSLFVEAKGRWVYQFSDEQKKQFAQMVAGKDVKQAEALLKAQSGVGNVKIQSNANTLPTDPNQINIMIQSVPDLQDTGGPPAPVTTPTGNPATPQPGRG